MLHGLVTTMVQPCAVPSLTRRYCQNCLKSAMMLSVWALPDPGWFWGVWDERTIETCPAIHAMASMEWWAIFAYLSVFVSWVHWQHYNYSEKLQAVILLAQNHMVFLIDAHTYWFTVFFTHSCYFLHLLWVQKYSLPLDAQRWYYAI